MGPEAGIESFSQADEALDLDFVFRLLDGGEPDPLRPNSARANRIPVTPQAHIRLDLRPARRLDGSFFVS